MANINLNNCPLQNLNNSISLKKREGKPAVHKIYQCGPGVVGKKQNQFQFFVQKSKIRDRF